MTPLRQDSAPLEQALGYSFRNPSLLIQALTHSSFVHESPDKLAGDNELLEFLGDRVLDLIITEWLLVLYPDSREGELSKLRAQLVSSRQLAKIAQNLSLGIFIRLGKGELKGKGAYKPSILANTLEAILGGIYLDGGLDGARAVIHRLFSPLLEAREFGLTARTWDFKSRLQEWTQARLKIPPEYRFLGAEGPDHDPTFSVALVLEGKELARGQGRSKKAAEQEAARRALEILRDL
jgi:ribonuclease-3